MYVAFVCVEKGGVGEVQGRLCYLGVCKKECYHFST